MNRIRLVHLALALAAACDCGSDPAGDTDGSVQEPDSSTSDPDGAAVDLDSALVDGRVEALDGIRRFEAEERAQRVARRLHADPGGDDPAG